MEMGAIWRGFLFGQRSGCHAALLGLGEVSRLVDVQFHLVQ